MNDVGVPHRLFADGFDADTFRVVSFSGSETINRPFAFEVLVLAPSSLGDSARTTLLGARAHLVIDPYAQGGRHVWGIVHRVDVEGTTAHKRGAEVRLRVTLVPGLALLAHRRNCRIFQDATVEAITKALLEPFDIAFRFVLTRERTPRTYCVQYHESDLAFLHRLLAEEGILYSFSHPADGPEEILFTDSATLYTDANPVERRFTDSDLPGEDVGQHLRAFRRVSAIAPSRFVVSRYDYMHPEDPWGATHDVATTGALDMALLEVFDHERLHDGVRLDGPLAEQHAAQHRSAAERATALSRAPDMTPGCKLTLTDNPAPALDGAYAVVGVRHEGATPEYVSNQEVYCNTLELVPADVVALPPRPTHRVYQALETATVVGPESVDIHTDALGRIQVEFHWDREGGKSLYNSCWLRVMQTWSGTGWGFQFIPRVGMEVLVALGGGHPDHPVVVGCVNNPKNPRIFPLPGEKTRSGIRTRSVPGGAGSNEVSFEDRAGFEQVRIAAQRDLVQTIGNNHTTTVAQQQVTIVGSNLTSQVAGNRTAMVSGLEAVSVGGDRRLAIGGDETLAISGLATRQVVGSQRDQIGLDHEAMIGGRHTTSVGGDWTVRVNGSHEVMIGNAAEESTRSSTTVLGKLEVTAAEALTITSSESITLRCGSSRLVMKPDEMLLFSDKLRIATDDSITLDSGGNELVLSDKAHINAKEVLLYSAGASLALDAEAKLDGAKVRLGSGAKPPAASDDSSEQDETEDFELALRDAAGEPLAGKRYEVTFGGQRLTGTTDGEGKVKESLPLGTTKLEVAVWPDDRTTQRHQIDLVEMPPASEMEGAQVRLKNLGYYQGDVHGELDKATQNALRQFQQAFDLEPTAELDVDTQNKLTERNGS